MITKLYMVSLSEFVASGGKVEASAVIKVDWARSQKGIGELKYEFQNKEGCGARFSCFVVEKAYNKVDICFCQKEENGYGVQVYKRRNHARAVIS